MTIQNQGNNEQISRGVFELHGCFTALTFSQSKTFSTRKGAEKWLAKRGYRPNGESAAEGGGHPCGQIARSALDVRKDRDTQ
jgi:hypothetical protein